MVRWSLILVPLLLSLSAARAEPVGNMALPLSRSGSVRPAGLDIAGVKPKMAKTVRAAISAARQASRSAAAAEAVIRAALEAGARAGKVRGFETLDLPAADGTSCVYQGRVARGRATGLGMMRCREQLFAGRFQDGRLNGLGGDTALHAADAYEGTYRDGARAGYGIERDKDGFYPGLYGLRTGANGKTAGMEVLGLQDFRDIHWAGRYGFYAGPRIACTLIKGAFLEGSVLDGYGAKFDRSGRLFEQGFYKLGVLANASGPPPC